MIDIKRYVACSELLEPPAGDIVRELCKELTAAREEIARLTACPTKDLCEDCGGELLVSRLTRCPKCCPMDDRDYE
jgi:hypothetical protein